MSGKDVSIRLTLKDHEVVRRNLLTLGDDGQKALAKIERASTPASRGLLALNAVSGELRGGIDSSASRMGALGAGLTALGPAGLAAAAGVGAAVMGFQLAAARAREALAEMDGIAKAADRIGVTTDALQELRYAAELAGGSAEKMDEVLIGFARRLGQARTGTGEMTEQLKKINPELLKQLQTTGSTEEALSKFLDVLAGTTNAQNRLALATAAFGEQGSFMVTMVKDGTDALDRQRQAARDLGLVYDESLLRNAEKTNDELATMQRIVDVQLNSALVSLGPVLTWFAQLWAEVARWIGEVVEGFQDLEARGRAAQFREFERVGEDLVDRNAQLLEKRKLLEDAIESGASKGYIEQAQKAVEGLDRDIAQLEKRYLYVWGLIDSEPPVASVPAAPVAGPAEPSPYAKAEDVAKWSGQLRAQTVGYEALRDTLSASAAEFRALSIQIEVENEASSKNIDLTSEASRAWAVAALEARRAKAALSEDQAIRKEGEALTDRMRTPQETYNASLERLNALLATGAISQETYGRAAEEARRTLEDSNVELKELGRFGEQAFDRVGSAMTQMAMEGKASWQDMGNVGMAVLSELAQEMFRLAAINPLKNAMFGQNNATMGGVVNLIGGMLGGLGGAPSYNPGVGPGGMGFLHYGGPRAKGGPVSPGSWYMVGEEGPEPFIPSVPGTIVPNHKMGGGGDVHVTVIDQRSSRDAAPVSVARGAGPDGRRQIKVLVRDSVREALADGSMDRALGQNYGLSRRGTLA